MEVADGERRKAGRERWRGSPEAAASPSTPAPWRSWKAEKVREGGRRGRREAGKER